MRTTAGCSNDIGMGFQRGQKPKTVVFVTRNDPHGPPRAGGDVRARSILSSLEEMAEVRVFRIPQRSGPDALQQGRPRRFRAFLASAARWTLGARSARIDRLLYSRPADRPATKISGDVGWFFKMPVFLATRSLLEVDHVVVDHDDLDDRKAEGHARIHNSLLSRMRVRELRAVRRRVQRLADVVVLCSELDASRSGAVRVVVVPNVVSMGRPIDPREGDALVMIGNFEHAANLDGARWMIEDVLPLIRAKGWDGSLRMVGHRPQEVPHADGVRWMGYVEDLDAAFSGARASVVPIRFGSGTRVKVIDALVRGVPVVSTSLGVEGLFEGRDQMHGAVLIADDEKAFADRCIDVLESPPRLDPGRLPRWRASMAGGVAEALALAAHGDD